MGKGPGTSEQALLERAWDGDQSAFGELVGPYRAELHAHGYRMLGSVHDAEDALQDALLRAWRGLPAFQGRSSVRSWLHVIISNAALDLARRRARREVPAGFSPAGPAASAGPGAGADRRPAEPAWLEPYPDRALGDPASSPEARYERRESLELAFIIALQQLPPAQRAVLILRDVVGLSAREIAGQLGTSVPAVTARCSAPAPGWRAATTARRSKRRCVRSATRTPGLWPGATPTPSSGATRTCW